MTSMDKIRKKKQAEADARIEKQREERRHIEEKERQRQKENFERSRYTQMIMEQQNARKNQEDLAAADKSLEFVKELEKRKQEEQEGM